MIRYRSRVDLRRLRTGEKSRMDAMVQVKLAMVGVQYAEAMRAEAPRSERSTTHGADKITYRVRKGGIDFLMPDYFRYVVEGTDPHVIEPRNGRALAFEYNGQALVVRSVHHPGTKANNFILRAWTAIRGRALASLGQAPAEWWAEL